jgi:uncharacterized protein
MKSFLTLFLLLFITNVDANSQPTVTVDATGEILVPADRVSFQINIRVAGDTPADVFEKHKEQERYLANLIRNRGLDDENLSFQPMNIGSRQVRNSNENEYISNQNVQLRLDDFELFEEMQILLIENGFENFSGRFNSSKHQSGIEEALDLAIENARKKAERIAANVGKKLGEVKTIDHTAAPVTRGYDVMMMDARSESAGMMQFEQTVPVTSSVRIVYELID